CGLASATPAGELDRSGGRAGPRVPGLRRRFGDGLPFPPAHGGRCRERRRRGLDPVRAAARAAAGRARVEGGRMSLERVVVGVDFTEGSTAAARWVARELAPDAELVLVYVVDIPTPPAFLQGAFPPHDELVQTTIRGAEARLRELGGELRARLMWTKVRVGQPAEEIAAEAEEMHAGLIVVGEHGKRRAFWDVLGSTAERVVAR